MKLENCRHGPRSDSHAPDLSQVQRHGPTPAPRGNVRAGAYALIVGVPAERGCACSACPLSSS